MKKYINIIRTAVVFAAMAISASCIKVDIVVPAPEESQVSLTFKCSDIAQTRATEPGDDAYNEDDIHTLDIFFYPSTAGAETPAIHHMHLNNLDENESYTYNQRIETSIIETIFGTSGTTARIYAIANFKSDDKDVKLSSTATVNQLKSTVIATAAFADAAAQDDFVMDSVGDSADDDTYIDDFVTYDSKTRSISGTIKLYRAASKIGLFISQVKEVNVLDENGEIVKDGETPLKWKAFTDQMTVKLSYGVKKTCLDNTVSPYAVGDDDYFSFTSENAREMQTHGSQWKQDLPFYSYPSDWNAENHAKEAYLTLMVPWAMSNQLNEDGTLKDGQKVTNTYYQIPINTQYKNLVRNTYYKISLVVSRLGSLVEEVPVVITPASYIILDWTTMNIDASLQDYRYLVVDQKEYTIYNQEELYIPFRSSHDTEIVNITFAQQDIKGTTASWTTIDRNNSNYLADLDIVGSQVYFKNLLDNVYTSSTFDFTPYRLTFRIKHTGTAGTTYYEDITVYQYPAIYGTPEINSDYQYKSDNANNDPNNGYVFVNGYQDTTNPSQGQDFFCSANGIQNAYDGASPNMYVFTITSVTGTDYVLGDPRENAVASDILNDTHNYGNSIWVSAPYFENGVVKTPNRRLQHYYATDASERTQNMIAPKFRLASTYSVLGTGATEAQTLEYLKKRCASYQEDGYPAGRWRLPTKAEFEFVFSQVNRQRLPAIYEVGSEYWCAHGLGAPQNNGTVSVGNADGSGHSVRCVYDEWYWKDKLSEEDKDTFTWGDMQR